MTNSPITGRSESRRLIAILALPVKLFSKLSKAALVILAVAVFSLNLITGMMTVAFTPVAKFFSIAVEAVTNGQNTHRFTQIDLDRNNAQYADRLAQLRAANTAEIDRVARAYRLQVEAQRTQIALLSEEVGELRRSTSLRYRGEDRLARQVVTDTTNRIRDRARNAGIRNVAAMPGEAIPIIGIGVVAGATAWEISDACRMMEDLYELDVAFNPDNAVPAEDTEVCGLRVPSRGEVWQMAKNSPGIIWEEMQETYAELPDFSEGLYQWTIVPALSWWDYFFGEIEIEMQEAE